MTEVERIDDIFYITDANGDPISDPEFCMELQQAVVNALSEQLELQASL